MKRAKLVQFQFVVEAGVEALTEAGGQLEDAVVGNQNDEVAGGVKNRGADLAGFEMAVDFGAQLASTSPSM